MDHAECLENLEKVLRIKKWFLSILCGSNDKKTGGAAGGGPPDRPQRKGAYWGMGGARTAGGGSRDRTRHYPLVKNPHKMEENH